MKIKSKLYLGFLILGISIGIISTVNFIQFELILKASEEIPSAIFELDKASKLDGLSEFIRYSDEVLTQSARNYAFTGDKKWETRYLEVEPRLDAAIKEAISFGNTIEKEFFEEVDDANQNLVKMEYMSIDFVNMGNKSDAIKILESLEYANQKLIYENGLRDYVEKRGLEYTSVLSISTEKVEDLTHLTQKSVITSRDVLLIVISTSVFVSLVLGFILARSIIRPINHLESIAKEISKENLDVKIEKISDDEMGSLTESFRFMIQEVKKSRELLVKKTKFTTIGELSARLAHDLRNPLTVIKNVSEILSEKLDNKLDETEKKNLLMLRKAIDRMSYQINDVMQFVKTGTLNLESIPIKEIIQDSINQTAIPKTISLNLDESKADITCDKEKMVAVFTNLIQNGIDAIDSEGEIKIKTGENNGKLVIEIMDSGKGIDDDKMNMIFEPLFTTKQKGMGLGLSTCKNIIEQHKGSISVKNNPTTFTITLPKN